MKLFRKSPPVPEADRAAIEAVLKELGLFASRRAVERIARAARNYATDAELRKTEGARHVCAAVDRLRLPEAASFNLTTACIRALGGAS